MTERQGGKLAFRNKLLLAVAAWLAIAAPVGFGLPNGRPGQASGAPSAASPQAFNKLLASARFEVASIKPLKPGANTRFANIRTKPTDPRFYAGGLNIRMVLHSAYGIEDAQIVGGPAWIQSERFDIEAIAPDSVAAGLRKLSPDQAKLVKQRMLQALLADRFKLKVRQETRVLPVYLLVVAKHGPKLEPAQSAGAGSTGAASHGNKMQPMHFVQPQPGETAMFAASSPMSSLAAFLSGTLGRPVLDRTGITGRYRFVLHWMPGPGECGVFGCGGRSGAGIMGEKPEAPGAAAPSGPSVFTAIEQQLGLDLKRGKGPVQVLVIDHIEPPTPN